MLRVGRLRKRYARDREGIAAVDDVSFQVPSGSFFTLLGPSGCGKTTTLRCIAGLERPEGGEIAIGTRLVFSSDRRVFVPPHRRRLGMVFQSYAIWPHMTVAQNVAYPLEARGEPRSTIAERVREALRMVDLPGLESRPATDLSGGQQQRVAVARAIVADAGVLLLDEPLSNVDSKLRTQMRDELRGLQQRLGVTTLYVTHDQEEALALSDVVAVMDKGKIVEMGPPADLYRSPKHRFTATFIGQTNLIPARITSADTRFAIAETPMGAVTFQSGSVRPGDALDLCVRPEDLHLMRASGPESPDEPNVLTGTVAHLTLLGAFADCRVQVGATALQLRLHPRDLPEKGESVRVRIPPEHCYAVVP